MCIKACKNVRESKVLSFIPVILLILSLLRKDLKREVHYYKVRLVKVAGGRMRALLSVFNKDGIVELAERLKELGIELIATDGTANAILKHGIPVKRVSEFTGVPEMLGGRIKTLHPAIHAGIATGDIGLVAVNLIPLNALTSMDIGGVALIRSALKNFEKTAVVVNPARYHQIIDELLHNGHLSYNTRLELACEASSYIAEYDSKVDKMLRKLRVKG